jgi:hypothetical protein
MRICCCVGPAFPLFALLCPKVFDFTSILEDIELVTVDLHCAVVSLSGPQRSKISEICERFRLRYKAPQAGKTLAWGASPRIDTKLDASR